VCCLCNWPLWDVYGRGVGDVIKIFQDVVQTELTGELGVLSLVCLCQEASWKSIAYHVRGGCDNESRESQYMWSVWSLISFCLLLWT
jgi:hypothetical protein